MNFGTKSSFITYVNDAGERITAEFFNAAQTGGKTAVNVVLQNDLNHQPIKYDVIILSIAIAEFEKRLAQSNANSEKSLDITDVQTVPALPAVA